MFCKFRVVIFIANAGQEDLVRAEFVQKNRAEAEIVNVSEELRCLNFF